MCVVHRVAHFHLRQLRLVLLYTPRREAEYCVEYVVCLSVCLSATNLRITYPNFAKFSVHVDPVLSTLCTSSFTNDDVVLSYYGPTGGVSLPHQRRCSVVHELTPLLRGSGCVLI